jgi:hypothetical protein
MSEKIPCYTCNDKFKNDKRQFLLNQVIEDAKIAAKKDNYTGFYFIYQRDNKLGFVATKDKIKGKRQAQSIYFDSGVAF